ncbi:unnamed protein product [Euphydryas editha]|uniref:Transposable element P transposase-like GTP-binding insertion domain-containing protein n=1 Tax=Euphydryas editha TaxID=104508 RepID=A0AAU9USC5_EUPED|nr:unnamed protein product [Euphydryas editha]
MESFQSDCHLSRPSGDLSSVSAAQVPKVTTITIKRKSNPVRNNFPQKKETTKEIKFRNDGKIKLAQWEHLRMLLNEDRAEDEIRIVNKLTEYNVDATNIPKMKVKYAAQFFSQRVFAVTRFLARHKILPEDVEDTANLLIMFNKLFNSFNGHLYHDTANVLKGCLKNNSPHFQFWNEITKILKFIEFIKVVKYRDGTKTIGYEKVRPELDSQRNVETLE